MIIEVKTDSYRMPLARLGEGLHEYEFHCDRQFFEALGREGIEDSDVLARVAVRRRDDRYHIDFSVKGNVTVACDRCLDPLVIPVDATYELDVIYGDEYDDSADNLLIIPENRRDLDVADIIADTIQLEIPMRAVHPDGECNPEVEKRLS